MHLILLRTFNFCTNRWKTVFILTIYHTCLFSRVCVFNNSIIAFDRVAQKEKETKLSFINHSIKIQLDVPVEQRPLPSIKASLKICCWKKWKITAADIETPPYACAGQVRASFWRLMELNCKPFPTLMISPNQNYIGQLVTHCCMLFWTKKKSFNCFFF